MPTFDELLTELAAMINQQHASIPGPATLPPITSAEELRTPVNALLATQPLAGPPVQPTGELRAYEPTPGERARVAVNALLEPIVGRTVAERVGSVVGGVVDVGPVPAQIATDVAMQPVRAGEAVGQALADPTLANVTTAAVRTAATLGRPVAAFGALGAGTLEALRRDLGLTFGSEATAETSQPVADPLASLYAQRAALERQRQAAQARMEAERRTGEGPRFQAAKQEVDRLSAELAGLDQMIANRERLASPEEQERQRAIQRAEAARERELRRERRFSDTEVGRLYERAGGLAPAIAGAITGGMSRLASGGGSVARNYILPAGLGAAAGSAAANLPLAYNALATEPDNPVRNALLAYARELPEGHPERERALREAASMPERNPIRAAAAEEFYDPARLAERSIMGGIEGLLGGMLGSDVVRIGGRTVNALMGLGGRPSTVTSAPAARPEVHVEKIDRLGRRFRYDRQTGRRVPIRDDE